MLPSLSSRPASPCASFEFAFDLFLVWMRACHVLHGLGAPIPLWIRYPESVRPPDWFRARLRNNCYAFKACKDELIAQMCGRHTRQVTDRELAASAGAFAGGLD